MTAPITSLTNPRVKHLVRLRNRRDRDGTGTFIIEGFRELSRAIEAGVSIETLYTCPALFLGDNEPTLIRAAVDAGSEIVELGPEPFRKAAYRDRPEGLLAVASQLDVSLTRLRLPAAPLVLIVESIEKPGNLGTMLRTADAAGAAAVIVADPTTDPFNPNAVRASIGSLFTVPLAVTTTDDAKTWLSSNDIQAVVTTPDAERNHWEADYTGGVAVVVGSEQLGLSTAWLDAGYDAVRIPMAGTADSLNAAMATGVVLFEAVRQRRRARLD